MRPARRARSPAMLAVAAAGAVLLSALLIIVVYRVSSPRALPTPASAPTPTDLVPSPARTPTTASNAASCGSSLQALIDATAAGGTLDLTGCTYSAGARIGKSLTLIGATLQLPAGMAGFTVAADDVTLAEVHIFGSQATRYSSDEIGVVARGTAGAPIRRLLVRDSEIGYLGGDGMYLRDVADLTVRGNHVHDVVYSGVIVLSGAGGRIEGNRVERIGVVGAEANSNNAYGITLTSDDAPTVDFTVAGNTVEDVPTWHALDTHGGQRIAFTANTVRRSMRGIFITTDDSANGAVDITVTGNYLGSPAPVSHNVQAVTTYRSTNVTITGNTAEGWGVDNFFGDYDGLSTGLVVSDNAVAP